MAFISHLQRGFTLLELLASISIVSLLGALLFPVAARLRDQTHDTKCMHNMRQVGIAIQSAATDNSGDYPVIENDPANPVHEPSEAKVWTLPKLVEHYGASSSILRCPADDAAKLGRAAGSSATASYFAAKGSSYEWFPLFEGENVNAPRIVTPRGVRSIPPGRARLLMDYAELGEAPHRRDLEGSTMHVAYADGSVRPVRLVRKK